MDRHPRAPTYQTKETRKEYRRKRTSDLEPSLDSEDESCNRMEAHRKKSKLKKDLNPVYGTNVQMYDSTEVPRKRQKYEQDARDHMDQDNGLTDLPDLEKKKTEFASFKGYLDFKSECVTQEGKKDYQYLYVRSEDDILHIVAFDAEINESEKLQEGMTYTFLNFKIGEVETRFLNIDPRRTIKNVQAKWSLRSRVQLHTDIPKKIPTPPVYLNVKAAKSLARNCGVHLKGLCINVSDIEPFEKSGQIDTIDSRCLILEDDSNETIIVRLFGQNVKQFEKAIHKPLRIEYGIVKLYYEMNEVHVNPFTKIELLPKEDCKLRKGFVKTSKEVQNTEPPSYSLPEMITLEPNEGKRGWVEDKIYASKVETFQSCKLNTCTEKCQLELRKKYVCECGAKCSQSETAIKYDLRIQVGKGNQEWCHVRNKASEILFEKTASEFHSLRQKEKNRQRKILNGEKFDFLMWSDRIGSRRVSLTILDVRHKGGSEQEDLKATECCRSTTAENKDENYEDDVILHFDYIASFLKKGEANLLGVNLYGETSLFDSIFEEALPLREKIFKMMYEWYENTYEDRNHLKTLARHLEKDLERSDLVAKLNSFDKNDYVVSEMKSNENGKKEASTIEDDELKKVAKQLSVKVCLRLGRFLGVKEIEMENVQEGGGNSTEKSFKILINWKETKPWDTRESLWKSLKYINRERLVKQCVGDEA